MAVGHLKDDLSYRDLLAGLFLAGVRNIKPHPVGFKFHAVMVINSALPAAGRPRRLRIGLLPCSGRLDTFKNSQAQDIKEGTGPSARWTRPRLPKPDKAVAAFNQGHGGLGRRGGRYGRCGSRRTSGAAEAMEPIWRMAVRDQRDIGHKPIFARAELADPARPSAGSTPSRSCAHSPSACSTFMATQRPVVVRSVRSQPRERRQGPR